MLDEMAHPLYREWFVRFRFPGHENVPRVSSPLGDIPQGWEVKTIAEVSDSVSYGYTASAVREEVGPKFLRITDIVPDLIDWADVPSPKSPRTNLPKVLLPLKPGDIVVARTGATTGYAKRLNKLHPDTVFASYLVRIRAKRSVAQSDARHPHGVRRLQAIHQDEHWRCSAATSERGRAYLNASYCAASIG